MVGSSSPVAAVPAAPVLRGAGREDEPAVRPVADFKPVEQRSYAETAAHKAAARAPADLVIRAAESGPRLIYIFRDPESGETIRQYPTEALVELGRRIGTLIDRQV